ncbi:putative quinone oxidoreductase [Ixodes scapularis]
MSVMRAVQVNKFGGPQVLQECNVPIPKVTPGKVLVRVKAAGVNPIDTYIREGTFPVSFQLPYTPGKDGAGLVEEVGQGDTPLKARCNVIGSRGDVKVNPCCLMGKESAVMGIALMKATPEEWQAMAENVARGAEEGWIKPVMDRVYPLGGAKAAHHDLINRKGAKGKVTLDPDQ